MTRKASPLDCGKSARIDGVDERVFCQRKDGHKKRCKAIWRGNTGLVAYKIKFRWRA